MRYNLQHIGIDVLNAMQQEFMQVYRKSDNMVLLSPTGSGKTLAFLLPLLEEMKNEGNEPQALITVPSRELAMQIQQVVKQLGSDCRALAVYGGRPTMEEHRSIRGTQPHLIIGTPGRLLDHLRKGNIDTKTIRTLVIDEFDKCLELGFREEMKQVLQYLPNIRRRVLLSATDNPEITRFLPEYKRLDYLDEDAPQGERIVEYVIHSPQKDKLETLRNLLLSRGTEMSLVFVGFRDSAERVGKFLHEEGFYVSVLHGGLEQRERERALYRFVGGSANILVSTDLASRGLDIPELDNVVHYHLPLNKEAYIHRNGRTARWDQEGRAFTILGPEEQLPDYARQLTPYDALSQSRTPQPPVWDCLYIGKGKRDKLSRGDIAGFLMKVGGLDKENVGRIDVRDHYSYVAISRSCVNDMLKRLRGQKIKGMKTIIERVKA